MVAVCFSSRVRISFRLRDVRDVHLDVVALLVLVGELLALAHVDAELAAALHEGEAQFVEDLGIPGDGFLRLGGERHPHRGDVHEHDHRSDGQRALRLLQAVVLPVGGDHRLGDGARGLLEQQRHAVGVADQPDGLVGVAHQQFLVRLLPLDLDDLAGVEHGKRVAGLA